MCCRQASCRDRQKVVPSQTGGCSRRDQVKQAQLKYVNPMVKEAANAARNAFGTDYEARLRQEAGPQPEKLARRKHQISSLYHQAKMKVVLLAVSEQTCAVGACHFTPCVYTVPICDVHQQIGYLPLLAGPL